jgi:hypothetical protein
VKIGVKCFVVVTLELSRPVVLWLISDVIPHSPHHMIEDRVAYLDM